MTHQYLDIPPSPRPKVPRPPDPYKGKAPATFADRVRVRDGFAIDLNVLRSESKLIFMAFNFEIDSNKVVYDRRLKTSGGCCHWRGGPTPNTREVVKISINPHIEEPLDVWEVLAHELSHGIQVLKYGFTLHDHEFYRINKIALECLGLPDSKPYRLHRIKSLKKYRRKT